MNMTITHDPLGLGNPYVPGPEERTPRHPKQGEPVKLGVLTPPSGGGGAGLPGPA